LFLHGFGLLRLARRSHSVAGQFGFRRTTGRLLHPDGELHSPRDDRAMRIKQQGGAAQ
jgi:hypothetical protein